MYSSSGVYDSFDRFGRALKFAWKNNVGTVLDQTDYTYDYVGNRLSRDVRVDLINGSYPNTRDQKYTYDGLHRLQTSDQGTLTSGAITSSNQQRYWELDQLGNWPKLRDGLTGSSTILEERTHNAVNELTGFTTPTSHADPAYDAAGNMTEMPSPADPSQHYDLKYDAWNRLVEVIYVETTIATMEYDGLRQRIRKVGSGTYDYYYNDQWQLLTEVKNGTDKSIYHWHPFYIDALAVRMRPGETHFFLQDANFNVTAAVDDATNAVVERYAYSPYGDVTFLDADFAADSDGVSDIANQHLYTGRERDPETGLQLNRHRFYSSLLGSWLSRDPLMYGGSSMNLYLSVNGNPISETDPTGLISEKHRACIGSALASGALLPASVPGLLCWLSSAVDEKLNQGKEWNNDKWAHCVVTCQASKKCGNLLGTMGGVAKEVLDCLGLGTPDLGDIDADAEGARCAGFEATLPIIGPILGLPYRESCKCCCDKKYNRWRGGGPQGGAAPRN